MRSTRRLGSISSVLGLVVALAGCSGGGDDTADDAGPADAGAGDGGGDAGDGECFDDGDCDDGIFCNGAETCDPSSGAAGPRGCVPGAPPCVDPDRCNEDEATCRTDCDVETDADGDGHDAVECGGDDCDDSDVNRFPGNPEICDADDHDEDCDPATVGSRDGDADGFVDAACCNTGPDGEPVCGPDCDDDAMAINPAASENCDLVDDDCDPSTFGDVDEDGDGFVSSACCNPQPDGTMACAQDCDDADANTHPGATERCDGRDNDCDGSAAGEDEDGDGHAPMDATCNSACAGCFPKDDCQDENSDVHPDQESFFGRGYCPPRHVPGVRRGLPGARPGHDEVWSLRRAGVRRARELRLRLRRRGGNPRRGEPALRGRLRDVRVLRRGRRIRFDRRLR